mmetsp:Transcript_94224/g.262228  ORF Transcript_94224/g.262228 Transcript_94224/m.262228 type:complete len:211 (+) Transcript_94224:345-977(+)
MESDLMRCASNSRRLDTRPGALVEQVESVNNNSPEQLHALSHIHVFLSVQLLQLCLACCFAGGVGLQGLAGKDLDWPMVAQRTVVEPHVAVLTPRRRPHVDKKLAQPSGEEDGVCVKLGSPIMMPCSLVSEDCIPHADEHLCVERSVPLASFGAREVSRHNLGVPRMWSGRQRQAHVAEDLPLVATEDANTAASPLHLHEPQLVPLGLDA